MGNTEKNNRQKALEMIASGIPAAEVARELEVNPNTIRGYKYREKQANGVSNAAFFVLPEVADLQRSNDELATEIEHMKSEYINLETRLSKILNVEVTLKRENEAFQEINETQKKEISALETRVEEILNANKIAMKKFTDAEVEKNRLETELEEILEKKKPFNVRKRSLGIALMLASLTFICIFETALTRGALMNMNVLSGFEAVAKYSWFGAIGFATGGLGLALFVKKGIYNDANFVSVFIFASISAGFNLTSFWSAMTNFQTGLLVCLVSIATPFVMFNISERITDLLDEI
jgi:hypothetical protein